MILPVNPRMCGGMHRLILAIGAGALLAGCQMTTGGPPQRVEPVAVIAPRTTSPVEEAMIGARENPRVVAEYGGVYSESAVEAATAKVVARLVSASQDPSRTYKITILNSPVVNAFALPNGRLYVTRGLLALANDTAEVAAVLSHEIAHVTLRHASLRNELEARSALMSRVPTICRRSGVRVDRSTRKA